MDLNRPQSNDRNLNNEEPVYMRSRMRNTDAPKINGEIDSSKSVDVYNCNCHMMTHFKNGEGDICIRNMKPFLFDNDKSTMKIINDKIFSAISSVVNKLSGSIKKSTNDEEKDK